jgi:hypothetical protein
LPREYAGSRSTTAGVRALVLFPLVLAFGGCSTASVPGPELRRAPRDLVLSVLADRRPTLLVEHPVLDRRGYVPANGDESPPPICITTVSGAATPAEILDAWTRIQESVGDDDLGSVEKLDIGGREGWGWRRFRFADDKLTAWTYTALLPDGESDRTYILEFQTLGADSRRESEVRTVLASFTVQRHELSPAKVGLAVVLLLGFAVVLRRARGGLAPGPN